VKGKTRNKVAANTAVARELLFMLGLGSTFCPLSRYFLLSDAADPYAFWETPPDPAEISRPSESFTVEQAPK
jgi:hypothetical protein